MTLLFTFYQGPPVVVARLGADAGLQSIAPVRAHGVQAAFRGAQRQRGFVSLARSESRGCHLDLGQTK